MSRKFFAESWLQFLPWSGGRMQPGRFVQGDPHGFLVVWVGGANSTACDPFLPWAPRWSRAGSRGGACLHLAPPLKPRPGPAPMSGHTAWAQGVAAPDKEAWVVGAEVCC